MKKTIAFNDKKNIWTSKYDYESSNYASMDKQFFSSRKRVESSDDVICWEHNTNNQNNSFYGTQYNSVISVSFNDNPSQNKLYKTFSVEGSENLTGSLHTFSTSDSLQPNQAPRAIQFGTVSNKGGILYGSIPKDSRVKPNVNLKLIGVIESDTEFLTIGGPMDDLYAFDGLYGAAPAFGNSTKLAFASSSSLQPVVFDPDGNDQSIGQNVDFYTLNSGFIVPSSEDLPEGTDSILVNEGIVFKASVPALASLQNFINGAQGGISVFAITDPSLNGDFLRGQYAESVINLGSQNFELYSLNVNYEPTDLDHSK